MNPTCVIKLDSVSKYYRLYPSHKFRLKEALSPFGRKYHQEFYALRDISLEISSGECIGVVGRNGSGKSTLLKLISGVIQPSAGSVQVNGSVAALLELGSGFNPEFTGLENIFFTGSLNGFSKNEMGKKVEEIIDFADIGQFIHQPVKTYSSGMTARLAFAVSTAINPDILILDEILAVGDHLFKRKCYARIERFMHSGKTILLVSHSLETINQLCSRAFLIDSGELLFQGMPKHVTTHYERLLYATPEDATTIRTAIKKAPLPDADTTTGCDKGTVQEVLRPEKSLEATAKEAFYTKCASQQQKPHFVAELVPKSTVAYRNYDVDIFDIYIETLNGERVNVLVMGDVYIYSYKVLFNLDAENVIFGMKTKTTKGVELEWACQPGDPHLGPFLPAVRSGEVYDVKWVFDCRLMPGYYYLNAGVSASIQGEMVFLNRLVDCMVFRIQQPANLFGGGLVHLLKKRSYGPVLTSARRVIV